MKKNKNKTKKVYIAKFRVLPYGNVFFKVGVSTEPRRRLKNFLSDAKKYLNLSKELEIHSIAIFEVGGTKEAYNIETTIKNALAGFRVFNYAIFDGFVGSTECFASSHYTPTLTYLSGGTLNDLVLSSPTSSLEINLRNLFSAKSSGLSWDTTRVSANSEQYI